MVSLAPTGYLPLNNEVEVGWRLAKDYWHQGYGIEAAHRAMNFAFDDCVELDKVIERNEGDWLKIFQNFEKNQYKNAQAIQEMALDNYIEMRDGSIQRNWLTKSYIVSNSEREF